MPSPESPTQSPDGATKVCPYCAEVIKAAAIKCRYCQSDLVGAPDTGPDEQVVLAPEPEPAAVEPLVATDPRRRLLLLVATGVALALVLLFLTLAFLDWRSAREITSAEDAARTVRATVTDKVKALLTYDHATFDKDLETAKEGMTESFQDEYEPTVAEIRDRALAQQRSQQADVVAVAVVSTAPEKVETLVFVNTISTRAGAEQQRLMQNRVLVTMVKQDGSWLIDELSVPQS